MNAPPPLSLYVHIPWCVRKCPYCDFNSHRAPGRVPEDGYVDALLADLDQEAARAPDRTVDSVFIGGGTPSLFSGAAIARLLKGVAARVSLAPGAEVTLEANPGTLEQARFADFRAAGVNRLSLGMQSFDDALLARLGRIHDGAAAVRAAEQGRRAGFERINLDLMHGLPGQTPEQALADLEQALALAPDHLSWYQLTLEPGTPFGRHPPPLPPEEVQGDIQDRGAARLAAAGFEHYEVSAYARPGAHCAHNLNYWRFGDYLGIGAGAHGKLTDAASGRVVRRWKRKHPQGYREAAGSPQAVAGEQQLQPADRLLEFMMNALRLTEGISLALLEQRALTATAAAEPALVRAEARGLLRRSGDRIAPTELGRRYLNDLVGEFLEPALDTRGAVP